MAEAKYQCSRCDAAAVDPDDSVTVFARKHGWALTRRFDPSGKLVFEWHCPACWQARRAEKRSA